MPDQDTHKVHDSDTDGDVGTADTARPAAKRHLWSGEKLQLWLFCILLLLALVGMGLTETVAGGGALYWLLLLWAYAFFSLGRSWLRARKRHESIWAEMHLHVFHWLGALAALHIIFLFERHALLARDAASDMALVTLALASYLAGLHFERLFVLIGILLGIMAIVGAFVEQYTLWLIVVPASVGAAWLFFKSKLSQPDT